MDMLRETSRARGADLAKLERYFREKVRETCFSRMMETPTSSSEETALDFLAVWRDQYSCPEVHTRRS